MTNVFDNKCQREKPKVLLNMFWTRTLVQNCPPPHYMIIFALFRPLGSSWGCCRTWPLSSNRHLTGKSEHLWRPEFLSLNSLPAVLSHSLSVLAAITGPWIFSLWFGFVALMFCSVLHFSTLTSTHVHSCTPTLLILLMSHLHSVTYFSLSFSSFGLIWLKLIK